MEEVVIHLFETCNRYYFYDVNVNSIIEIDFDLYNTLLKKDYIDNKKVEHLKEQGFLLPRRKFDMKHPFDHNLEGLLERNLKTMTLQVTKNCNLRCKYCVYSGSYTNRLHKNERMSKDVAFQAIDFFLEHSVDSEYINLGFYGGEPTLEFELLQNCIHYIEKCKSNKTVSYSLTTNATLLTEEMIKFFNEYKVELTISLDGPKELHNRNRVNVNKDIGSFEKVVNSIEMVERTYPDYIKMINFNAVMIPEYGFDIYNKFFSENDLISKYPAVVNLPSENYTQNKYSLSGKFIEEFNYELFRFYFSVIKKDSTLNISKLLRQHYQRLHDDIHEGLKITTGYSITDHHSGPCVVGRHRLFIDTSGNFYPCERVSECSEVMKIGNIYDGFEINKVREMLNIGEITEQECRDCWAFRFCTLCAVKADNGKEFSAELKLSHCNNVRKSIDDRIKDYCMFKEMGYDFEKEN